MRELKRLQLVIFSICTLQLIVFAAPAQAIDVTFHVPVQLANMPASITGGAVNCAAYSADRIAGFMYPSSSLGKGTTNFVIRGNFNSTVDVVIRNYEKFPASGLGWQCVLFLIDRAEDDQRIGGKPAGIVIGKYAVDKSKPVKYEVSGIK